LIILIKLQIKNMFQGLLVCCTHTCTHTSVRQRELIKPHTNTSTHQGYLYTHGTMWGYK